MWLLPLLGCLTYVGTQHIHCDYGWTAFKNGCWIKRPFLPTEYKSWFHAQAGCRAFRGKLAMFTDADEYQDTVRNVFNTKAPETVWIGLRRVITMDKKNRSWEWPRYKEIPEPFMPNITVTDADWDNRPFLCGTVSNDPNLGIKLIAEDCITHQATSYACFIPGGRSCSRNADFVNGTCRCKQGYVDVLDSLLNKGDLDFERGEKCVSENMTARPTTVTTTVATTPSTVPTVPPTVAPIAAPTAAPVAAPTQPPIVAQPVTPIRAPVVIQTSCDKVKKSLKVFFLLESTKALGQETFNQAAAFINQLRFSLGSNVPTKTMTYGAMGEFTDHNTSAPVFVEWTSADTMNALKRIHNRIQADADHQVIYILNGNLPTASNNLDNDFKVFSQYIEMLQRTNPTLRIMFLALTNKLDAKAADLQKLLRNPADFVKLDGALDAKGAEQVLKQTCDAYV